MTGIEMIAAERRKQLAKWTAAHDDAHDKGQLEWAARAYSVASHLPADMLNSRYMVEDSLGWPFEFEAWQPGPPIEMLAKAGALIAAEIDRQQRQRLRTWIGRRVCVTTDSSWKGQVGLVKDFVPENSSMGVRMPDGLIVNFFEHELGLLEAAEYGQDS